MPDSTPDTGESEIQRLRRVNGEWGLVMSTLIDGLAERSVPVKPGSRYTQAALDEIDRLRAELAQALRERDEANRIASRASQDLHDEEHEHEALSAEVQRIADDMDRWGAPRYIRETDPTLADIDKWKKVLRAALDTTGEVTG